MHNFQQRHSRRLRKHKTKKIEFVEGLSPVHSTSVISRAIVGLRSRPLLLIRAGRWWLQWRFIGEQQVIEVMERS